MLVAANQLLCLSITLSTLLTGAIAQSSSVQSSAGQAATDTFVAPFTAGATSAQGSVDPSASSGVSQDSASATLASELPVTLASAIPAASVVDSAIASAIASAVDSAVTSSSDTSAAVAVSTSAVSAVGSTAVVLSTAVSTATAVATSTPSGNAAVAARAYTVGFNSTLYASAAEFCNAFTPACINFAVAQNTTPVVDCASSSTNVSSEQSSIQAFCGGSSTRTLRKRQSTTTVADFTPQVVSTIPGAVILAGPTGASTSMAGPLATASSVRTVSATNSVSTVRPSSSGVAVGGGSSGVAGVTGTAVVAPAGSTAPLPTLRSSASRTGVATMASVVSGLFAAFLVVA